MRQHVPLLITMTGCDNPFSRERPVKPQASQSESQFCLLLPAWPWVNNTMYLTVWLRRPIQIMQGQCGRCGDSGTTRKSPFQLCRQILGRALSTVGADHSLFWRLSCASLLSTHSMPALPPPQLRQPTMFPDIAKCPRKTKWPPVEKHGTGEKYCRKPRG